MIKVSRSSTKRFCIFFLGALSLHGLFGVLLLQQDVRENIARNEMRVRIFPVAESVANEPNKGKTKTSMLDEGERQHAIKRGEQGKQVTEAASSPIYFSGDELDAQPVPSNPIIVPYPDADLGKPEGSVTLVLYVSEMGDVDRIEIYRTDAPREFVEAAIKAFSHAKLVPAIKDGKAVFAMTKIQVDFESAKKRRF